ncbi:MAG: tRNA (adenosine(37)-N6)-threonylcarbamoyltransferase complex ATPase subunit type 1 TsaE [SAR324 cluster bacterium]|nr:tRNA (adenosine(37)-N6)-threonylcarbamoyltransferase complex ATPase subunit type 1 TsaE [SAR324 cluster bacterium]
MRKLILDLSSLENTDTVARKMAANLFPGAILLFWGSMGAGKTTFAKSLCAGLGVLPEIVTSPTYTLVNIYPGDWPVFHVDLYRLNAQEELDDFDREDLITSEGVTLVEWPQYLLNYLSDEPVLNLVFETVSEYQRRLSLESESANFDILYKTLEQQNSSQPKSANSLNRTGT